MSARKEFHDELRALVLRYNLRMLAPEMIGELGMELANILTSCPAEQRMTFSEQVFANLLREIRRSLQ